MIALRPVRADDADALYPLVDGAHVTDTLLWDGPASLDELRASLAQLAAAADKNMFTILDGERPIGCCDVRPESDFRGDCGLWIGEPYHGRGYGTEAVRLLQRYAFDELGLAKLEATVFVGNVASRRIFEKNGFLLEGTIRRAARKRGRFVDEWLFGKLREEL